MMSFREFLQEAIKPTDKASIVGSGRGQLDLSKYLRKECGISGKGTDTAYFDGVSLVYGSNTVLPGAISSSNNYTVSDLVSALKKAKK